MISIIAAIGKNNELGRGGDLVFHIREDMRYFRDTTAGHKVVMGRKTWESLPGKLPGRENIVVSSRDVTGADLVVRNLEEFLQENAATPEEVFVIGGGQVYKAALPYAKILYLTEVDAAVSDADTYFPEFDKNDYERQVIKEGKDDDLAFTFVKYTKK